MTWLSDLPEDRTAIPALAPPSLTPQGRLLVAAAAVLAIVSLTQIVSLTLAVAVAIALALALGVPVRTLGTRLRHVEGFVLIVLIVLPLSGPAPMLATFGPVAISEPGLERAIALALKVNAGVIILFALVSTLEPVALARGLTRLGAPERLIQILLVALRYLPLLHREAGRLSEAMRARGFQPGLNRHTLRTAGHLVGTLLVRALERAERVDEAMRCRAFTGRFPIHGDGGWRRRDAVALVILDRSLG